MMALSLKQAIVHITEGGGRCCETKIALRGLGLNSWSSVCSADSTAVQIGLVGDRYSKANIL